LDEQREIIKTFSEMAPRYEKLMDSELNRFWGINYHDFVSGLLDDIELLADETILDIATGTGYIPSYIDKNHNAYDRIFGLDITFDMLLNSGRNLDSKDMSKNIDFVCASAHAMPFQSKKMDHIICCLATHHMDIDLLLKNIQHCLKKGGTLHIADAGGSSKWKNRIIKTIIKILAFVYFFFIENLSRARAESAAVANIHTADEWKKLLEDNAFRKIEIIELKSRRFWAPNPLIMKASN
jgi:ubiquinone/menaquinone biosynthesis C-methylase UbiE